MTCLLFPSATLMIVASTGTLEEGSVCPFGRTISEYEPTGR
jgi:hypothetical protein